MLTTFINTLMSAEADAVCGAADGEPPPERTNPRNGYRARDFDTRAGTLDVAIPKLRVGQLLPGLAAGAPPPGRAALTTVVATCYLLGVSTRRMEKLVETLGITRLSKSQVSEMAHDLDAQAASSATARWTPALTRSWPPTRWCSRSGGGRVVNVHALVATGVNAEGTGRSSGCRSPPPRTAPAGWRLPRPDRPRPDRGRAGDQRRARRARGRDRRDPARRVLAAVSHALRGEPHGGHPEGVLAVGAGAAALGLRPARRRDVHAQFDRVLDALADKLPAVAGHLDAARADVLAFTASRRSRRQIWSNNPQVIWSPPGVFSTS